VGHDNGSAVTIGAYDGVHIGHRQVIGKVRRRAASGGLRSVVVTFDKNPAAVVNPASAPLRLTDIELKLELLAGTGVDQILVIEFDAERAREEAEDFVAEVLVAELSARVVVVGDDFHFGHQRRGNVALLQELGEQAGFSVEPVHLVSDDRANEVVSSTRIRGLIARGELSEAAVLLGRPHEVRALVVSEGKDPGDPSRLSVEVPGEILLPPPGDYPGFAVSDTGESVPAQLALPAREGGGPRRIEVTPIAVSPARPALDAGTGGIVRVRFG
jgi:riboflavin kinase/FMN adenylyltransferase